jgi:peptide/nickel transport system substrate-binding protein
MTRYLANGRFRRRGLIAGLVAVALVAASCGDDDDDAEPTAAESETAPEGSAAESATATEAPTATDSEAASETATSEPTASDEPTGEEVEVDTTPLVIARNMDLTSLDPHRAVCDTCQFIFTSLYETLVGLDTDNKTLIPNLAESWEISDDSTVYTFHIAPDAVFSDGSPVESKDVAFSLMRLKNLKISLTYLVDDIVSIDTPDPKTAVVTLGVPNAEFLNNMNAAYPVIVNSDVAKENGATDAEDADVSDTAEPWFIENAAGSGPYVLESFTQGDEITLTANPNYWSTPARISTVTVRQAETAAAQAQMLQTGEADIAMQIDPITARSLEGVEDVTVESIPSFNFLYIMLAPGVTSGTSTPLDDTIREAIRKAIDYQGLIDTLLDGRAQMQASPIPNGFPGADGLVMTETDVEAAKQLLADAGVTEMTLTLGYPTINAYGVDFGQLAQVLQQQLAEVGITLELAPDTFAVMIDKFRTQQYSSNLLYWAPDYYGSAQYVGYFGLVEGARAANNAGGSDETPLINQAEQEAYDAARAASDPEERAALYHTTGEEMIKDNVVIPLFSPDLMLTYRSNVEGVTYSACCNLVVDQISRTD